MKSLSVVIPNFNQSEMLLANIGILKAQALELNIDMEIIIVDNGSSDLTREEISSSVDKYFLFETERNPYICRNIGMENAGNELLLLLDAGCRPAAGFLHSIYACLHKYPEAIILGHLIFIFPEESTVFHLVDALFFMPNEENAPKGSAPVFACLINSALLNDIGKFREDMRSGADLEWTRRASEKGYRLMSCKEAVVEYSSRGFRGLMRKAYRIGRGHGQLAKVEGNYFPISWFFRSIWSMRPMWPPNFVKLSHQRLVGMKIPSLFRLYFAAWLFQVAKALGKVCFTMKNTFGNRNDRQ